MVPLADPCASATALVEDSSVPLLGNPAISSPSTPCGSAAAPPTAGHRGAVSLKEHSQA
jgi:hypothetical protein